MARRYKCPYCEDKYERQQLVDHIDNKHEDLIPENYTASRVVFNLINKRECGYCRVCHKETEWDERSSKYAVLCNNPKCKEALRKQYQENMIRVRGTDNILNDPEQQKKMLANRSISGKYKFTDGGILTYTGSYEKKCLEFMDKVLEIPSKDILSPGPTLEYEMNGEKHFYITDFYLIPQNLIIEVKDGGDNLNTKDTPGMRSSRERTLAKEKLITESGEYNYVRLTNNDFAQLLDVLMEIKEAQFDKRDGKIIKINESYINESLDIDFNTPEELSNWMKKNIKYKEYDKLMSAKEVYDTKHGSCHDQVVFEDEIFKNMKIKHGKLFFIEYNEGEQQGGKTHTLLYYIKDNKYYWFENAWGGEEGIHGPYDSLSSLKDDVKERNMKNSNYDDIEFSTVKNIKTGMTLGEYVSACLKQTESVVNEVFRGTPMKSDLDPNFIPKDKFYLNDFTKNKIDKVFLNKYKGEYKTLKHVDPKNNGYVWMDDDKVVGYCSVDRDKELPWITALEVTEEYKGHGLGEQLLDYAVNELGGQALTVAKDNMIAKRMYDNYGFKASKTSQEKADTGESAALFMYLDPSKSYLVESVITESYNNNCLIISCFAGVGKNYAINQLSNMGFKVYSIEKERDFYNTICKTGYDYTNYINKLSKSVDILFIPYFLNMENRFINGRVDYYLVYPSINCKNDYVKRFKELGFTKEQIKYLSDNWNDMITDCITCDIKNNKKIELNRNEYVLDVILNLLDIVNESVINESSSITLYHGTDNPDFDLILPNSYNVGTHTSKPRMSSYWFDNAEYAKIFATMTVLDNNLPKDPNGRVCLDNDMSILVPNKYKITTINLLKNSNGYVYYRTITNKSVISRGHARYFPEYTIDVPIKPDGIIKVSYKDMINNIKFIDQDYYEEVMHKYATDNIRYDVSVLQQIFDIITKYSTGDIPKRKRELKKLAKFNSLGESVDILNESDIEYLNNYIL